MEMGHGRLSRKVKFGVFAASLMLALMVPVMAFAATATFTNLIPASGSSSTVAKPTITITVYDRFGVSGSSNYSLTLDGSKKTTKLTRVSGWGLRKFKLSYAVPSNLSIGSHTVVARVKDGEGHVSTKTWSFTVLDSTPPVTTSDVALNYIGLASIHLSATDNVEVDETFYRLDGGAVTEYVGSLSVMSADAYHENHSLEFWSEDEAGNVEAHHMVFFIVKRTFAMNHALPTDEANSSCVLSGCHGKDHRTSTPKDTTLADIHNFQQQPSGEILPPGCAGCHSGDVSPTSDCTACHGPNGPHGGTHEAIASEPTTSGAPVCTQSGCHDIAGGVVAIHEGDCATCHDSPFATVQAVVAAGDATCEDCHYNAHTPDFTAIHAAGNVPHATVASDAPTSCVGVNSDCHRFASVITIHATQLPEGPAPRGCATCHDGSIDLPTSAANCTQSMCHPDGLSVHPALETSPSAHVTVNTCASGNKLSGSGSACHSSNVATIHTTRPVGSDIEIPGCVACHGVGVEPSNNCSAEGCHDGDTMPLNPHADVTFHQLSTLGGCANPQCHSNDVMLIHGGGIKTARPGCADCHTTARTSSFTCSAAQCHPTLNTANDPHNAVFDVFTDNGHASLLACSACHAQTTGIKACTECHGTSTLASLGSVSVVATSPVVDFSVGQTVTRSGGSTYTPTDVLAEVNNGNASRHKIEGIAGVTANSVGMRSRFDGSQGSTLVDTNGDTVVTTWGVPTVDVFWGSNDASAPASAMKGLTPNSMIHCEDCHTGSDVAGAAGPHGSSVQWIIDPNYPGRYEQGVLSHSGLAVKTASGIMTRKSVAATTTATTDLADGTTGAYAMICAKCHDLYNVGTGLTGTSNRAHGSHHYDRVDGSADCISCHVAIPHGWKRPRLLLDSSVDVAPYKSPEIRGRIVSGQFVGIGMGPISAGDDHSLDASGSVPWTEAKCIACGDEHEGEGNLSAAFSITTTGTTVVYYATTGPTMGIAEYDVDEDPETSTALQEGFVDLYSPTIQYQVPVLTLTMPDALSHVVEVEWTGTKNAASSDTFINVDKFVTGGTLTIEQTVNRFSYDGIWTTVTIAGPSAGSYTMSKDPGNDFAKLR